MAGHRFCEGMAFEGAACTIRRRIVRSIHCYHIIRKAIRYILSYACEILSFSCSTILLLLSLCPATFCTGA